VIGDSLVPTKDTDPDKLSRKERQLDEPDVVTAADEVFNTLIEVEGASGDTATNTPTGELGVTASARSAVEGSDTMTDPEIAKAYLNILEGKWDELDGFRNASIDLKKALIDASYNLGESILGFSGIKASLALVESGGTEESVLINILDTANIGKKSSKGLAVRRAKGYNMVADNPIVKVIQKSDGTIVYKDSEGNIIFEYKPSGGKHTSSDAGTVNI
jgi:hypothetical protein